MSDGSGRSARPEKPSPNGGSAREQLEALIFKIINKRSTGRRTYLWQEVTPEGVANVLAHHLSEDDPDLLIRLANEARPRFFVRDGGHSVSVRLLPPGHRFIYSTEEGDSCLCGWQPSHLHPVSEEWDAHLTGVTGEMPVEAPTSHKTAREASHE